MVVNASAAASQSRGGGARVANERRENQRRERGRRREQQHVARETHDAPEPGLPEKRGPAAERPLNRGGNRSANVRGERRADHFEVGRQRTRGVPFRIPRDAFEDRAVHDGATPGCSQSRATSRGFQR